MSENNLKILLVDDVEFFRVVMRDYFKRTPASILMATNGEEAIAIAQREWPQLIYMDVSMPVMNGIEACRKIKAHPQLSRIPVLLIFTPNRDATEEQVQKSGCDGYLTKPFGREEFLNLGHRYLFHIERREHRVPCEMTVDFRINEKQYKGRGVDISMHGLYIEFRGELHPDRRIEVSFTLPNISPEKIRARGRIAWVNQGFPRSNLNMPQGFGVEIQSINMPSVDILRKYLEQA